MKKGIKLFIVTIVMVGVIVGYYYYLSSRNGSSVEDQENLTEVEKLVLMDVAESYPETPREVVKLFSRIMSCYYNEECTEEELDTIAGNAWTLMDSELQENNPVDVYRLQVQNEVTSYKTDGKTISNYSVCSSNDIVYRTVEKRECAYVDVSYYIKQGTSISRSNETFLLRKDDGGKWKILAFYLDDDQ